MGKAECIKAGILAWQRRQKLKERVATLLVCVAVAGCVKLQILPDGTVENTIKSTKDIYEESRLKRSGGEKRHYSRQVNASEYETQVDAEIDCIAGLLQKATGESASRAAEKVSETVSMSEMNELKVIDCQLVAYVWP